MSDHTPLTAPHLSSPQHTPRTRLAAWSALAVLTTLTVGATITAAPAAAAESSLQAVAHRGDKEHHPDNSLAGIASAIEKNAGGIEIDVHYNPDGDVFFVSHDNLCSGPRGTALIDLSSAEKVEKNCQLPTLDDVFDLIEETGYTSFFYEFKHTASTAKTGGTRLAEELDEHGLAAESWITGFSDTALKAAQNYGTEAKLMRVRTWTGEGPVTTAWIDAAAAQGFDAININIDALRESSVEHARSKGLTISGWAYPDAFEEENQQAIDLGVDIFMTDRLDDLIARLGR